MAQSDPQRYVLFRKIVLGVFWFGIMWIGLHSITNLYVGFLAGYHNGNPSTSGLAGARAAEDFSHRYGPVLVGIAFGLTMAGLRNGFFLSKKLRPAQRAAAAKKPSVPGKAKS
jgi:hypothetical protein